MDHHQEIVLLFTRYPQPGVSKTRLIPIIGAHGAASLQRQMTERIINQISLLAQFRPHSLEIHYDGGSPGLMHDWLGPHTYIQQTDDHLGLRMANAIATHLQKNKAILLIGSDCPENTAQILAEALDALTSNDMVIGPAYDGGYYLIGVNGALSLDIVSSLFTGISWGSRTVYAATMAKIKTHQLNCHILPKLHDIDRPEDLRHINHHPDAQ